MLISKKIIKIRQKKFYKSSVYYLNSTRFNCKRNFGSIILTSQISINKRKKRRSDIYFKRFYHVNYIIYGKDKFLNIKNTFLQVKKVFDYKNTIYNYLKLNVQKDLTELQKIIFKHPGVWLKGKFITLDNKINQGFVLFTTKDVYKVKIEKDELRFKSINLGDGNKLS